MGSRFAEGFLTRILYMALIYNMNYEYKSSYLHLWGHAVAQLVEALR